jgi:hypothetical protein
MGCAIVHILRSYLLRTYVALVTELSCGASIGVLANSFQLARSGNIPKRFTYIVHGPIYIYPFINQ